VPAKQIARADPSARQQRGWQIGPRSRPVRRKVAVCLGGGGDWALDNQRTERVAGFAGGQALRFRPPPASRPLEPDTAAEEGCACIFSSAKHSIDVVAHPYAHTLNSVNRRTHILPYEHLQETELKKLHPKGLEINEVITCASWSMEISSPTKEYSAFYETPKCQICAF
jgi:hypothetical protein